MLEVKGGLEVLWVGEWDVVLGRLYDPLIERALLASHCHVM